MLRSLIAVIVAAILAMTVARFFEGAAGAQYGVEAGAPAPDGFGYRAFILGGWFAASLAAALVAVAIGRRWAPLGWLMGAAMGLNAMIAMFAQPLGWWMWPAGLIACIAGSGIAVRLLGRAQPVAGRSSAAKLFEQ